MFRKFSQPFFSPDPGTAGAPPTEPPAEPPPVKSEAELKAETDAKAKGEPAKGQEKMFTQAELDAHIKERLLRAEENSKKEADKAARQAEEAAAAKNGEWQKVAEGRLTELEASAKRIVELEPFQEQAGRYKKALDNYVKPMVENLPEPIKALLAGKDPVEQIEYLTKYGATLGVKNGVPATPPPDEGALTNEQRERARKEYERNIRNMKP